MFRLPFGSFVRFASTSSSLIGREIYANNSIVRLILKDPKRRNALSFAMMDQLYNELKEIDEISKVRSVIIAAEGKVFSSGHDLKELRTASGDSQHLQVMEKCAQLVLFIQNMKLPVIAEVGGLAAAAGCQLVASCDVVVASESSHFMVPGQKVGLFCSTPGIALSRAVPWKLALDMLLTADPIDAQTALRAGLVSRVVKDGEERHESVRVAESIGRHSREVTALGKAFFHAQKTLPAADAYRLGARVMVENLRLVDAQEGISAFVEKRDPVYTHSGDKVSK